MDKSLHKSQQTQVGFSEKNHSHQSQMKEESQKQPQQPENQIPQEPIWQLHIQSLEYYRIKSEFKSTYLKKLAPFSQMILKEILTKLHSHGIQFTEKHVESLKKTIYSKDGNSVKFIVKLGYFQTTASILKVHLSSEQIFSRKIKFFGSFGCIYEMLYSEKAYAIKSQSIKPRDRAQLNKKIDAILQEYLYYKIASILGFGPKMENIFGYDLICYNDSIEFAMELCQQPENVDERKNMRKNLFENLKTMHSFKMVHRDVKSPNIGWSPEFGRWVFLDFGFTTFLKESIGEKTYTRFIGTYREVSAELQRLYYLEDAGRVDFYYNDVHGLERSLQKLKKQNNKSQLQNEEKEDNFEKLLDIGITEEDLFADMLLQKEVKCFDYNSYIYCLFYRMKFFLFEANFQQIQNLLKQNLSLRQVYIFLLIKQIEKLKQNEQYQRAESVFKIYQNYKELTEEQQQQLTKVEKIMPTADSIKKYCFREEKKQQKEWEELIFYFENEKSLTEYIQKSWPSVHFAKNLLKFIDQCSYNPSITMQDRLKTVIQIINKSFILKNQGKSDFWKFRQVIYGMEYIFMEHNSLSYHFELQKILRLYCLINDTNREKLVKIWQENNSHKINEGVKIMTNVFTKIQIDYNFSKLKEQVSFIKECQNVEPTSKKLFLNIMEVIIKATEKQCFSIEDNTKLRNMIDSAQNDCHHVYISMIAIQIQQWKKRFLERYPNHSIKIGENKIILARQLNKVQAQSNLNESWQKSVEEMDKLFEKNPFMKQISSFVTLRYYQKKKNDQKVKEIREDLIDMWQYDLQNHASELNRIIGSLKSKEVNEFIANLISLFKQNNLSSLKKQKILNYWQFFDKIVSIFLFGIQEEEDTKNLLFTLQTVLKYFSEQNLIEEERIYRQLIRISVLHFENKKEECINYLTLLHDEGVEKKKQWQNHCYRSILRVSCCYQQYYQSKALQERILREWEQFPINERNWYYQKTIEFLVLITKILAKRNRTKETYATIKDLTSFLTKANKSLNIVQHYFQFFIDYSTKEQLFERSQMILKEESYTSIKNDNYLSALVLMITLSIQRKLKERDKCRMLILSMLSIDKFPAQLKLKLRNSLILKCKQVQEWQTVRKKTIMMRREGYASGKVEKFEENIKKRVRRCHERVRYAMGVRLRKIRSTMNEMM